MWALSRQSEICRPNDHGRNGSGCDCCCGHCQTNLSVPAKGAGLRRSGRQLTPLRQGGRTVLFEDVAAVEVTVVVEVVVD